MRQSLRLYSTSWVEALLAVDVSGWHWRGVLPACLLLWSLASPAVAGTSATALDPRNLLFSRISLESGLSQAGINSIVQDGEGFIWFGTQEGLNRYDGNEIHVYEHQKGEPGSLSNNWVWSLFVDDSGTLWVGTEGGGLNYFDRKNDSFKHYRHDADNAESLSSDRVRVIYQDRSGRLWVGTDGGGLNAFDPKTGHFQRFQHDPERPESLPNDSVLAIHEDRAGNLWVGTQGGGLSLLNHESGQFIHYQHDPQVASSLSDNQVRSIYEDRDGQLWIGTYRGGLNLFDPRNGTFQRMMHDPEDPTSLSNNRVRSVYQDHEGTLWVATDNGLNEWRPVERGFVRYDHDPTDTGSLSDNRVTYLYQDRGSVLWVGTHNGINHWNYSSDAFTYFQSEGTNFKLSGNVVTSVAESDNGELWVGSYGEGLNRINLADKTVQYYRAGGQSEQTASLGEQGNYQLADNRIMAVHVAPDQGVWIGARSAGLSRLDPVTGKFDHYRHDPAQANSLSNDNVTNILAEANGTVWIGTYGGGLNRLDIKTATFSVYRHDPDDASSIGSDRVLTSYRDRAGRLWIGTEDGGLNYFDEINQSFVRYVHDPENDQSLSGDAAWAIHEGRDGSLWVGTNGAGLNRWAPGDRAAGRALFSRHDRGTQLPSDTVLSILEDNAGFIWLSSNRGLVQLDPNGAVVRHFNHNSGLRGAEFNFAAASVSRTGRLMFGGPAGLLAFYPNQLITNRHQPDIALGAFNRLGPLDTRYSISPDKAELELGFREDLITFEFAGLDYAAPGDNLYRYKLEGFDESWSEPGSFRRATYTSLPAGSYNFLVQASNNFGVWSEQGVSMRLRVVPPPWRSNGAYAAYLLLVLAAVYRYVRNQHRQLEIEIQQREQLKGEVQQRTAELAERNEQLLAVNDQLKESSWSDSLTGLKNRRYLDEFIDVEVALALRQLAEMDLSPSLVDSLDISPALSFMMIDLDNFKSINDNFGHVAGDQALLQVSDILQKNCRKSDTIIRWGGDEFLIVSRNTSNRAAEHLAERIRVGLAEHIYQLGGGDTARLSGSIGFAVYPFSPLNPDLVTWEETSALADQCAYLAKKNGRNAWVGIYGMAGTTVEDVAQLKIDMEAVLARGRIGLRTSIYNKINFSDKTRVGTI